MAVAYFIIFLAQISSSNCIDDHQTPDNTHKIAEIKHVSKSQYNTNQQKRRQFSTEKFKRLT